MPARSPTWHCSPTPSPCRTTNPASSDRTWNAVSAEGVKLISTTLDTVGWYARSVADLALLADTFALQDDEPSVFRSDLERGQRGGGQADLHHARHRGLVCPLGRRPGIARRHLRLAGRRTQRLQIGPGTRSARRGSS